MMNGIREDKHTSLYDILLPHIQDANTYGGGAATFLLRKQVLDAIDHGADSGDATMIDLRKELHQRSKQWKQVQDHEAFSRLFDTYCEATFYLAATWRGIDLEAIPEGENQRLHALCLDAVGKSHTCDQFWQLIATV